MRAELWGVLVAAMGLAAACGGGDDDVDGSSSAGVGGSGTSSSVMAANASGTTGPVVAASSSAGSGGALSCNVPYTDLPGDCDLLSQDCPTGQHCLVGSKGTECVPGSGGLKTMGMKCNAGECGAGMHCLEGHCSAFCCPETNEPCGDGACDVQVSFSVGYAMMCSFNPGCLLFEGDCPKGQHCHIGDAEAGLAVCDKPSDSFVDESEVCIFRNDCGESQLCNKNGADRDGEKGRCRHLCKPSAWEKLKPSKGGCLAERTCEKANAGTFTDLGICSPVDP